jgi:biopolymer transport protein ExbD
VGTEKDPKVVIRGDAKLNFREVRQAMIAIEDAGFRGVGLAAKGPNPNPKAKGD